MRCALRRPLWKGIPSNSNAIGRHFSSQAVHEPETAKTHFGFKTVDRDQKSKLVGDVFRSVADKYDVMNDLMSVGIHRIWKDEFIDILGPSPGTQLVDVAGGTGDIAQRFLTRARQSPRWSPKSPATRAFVCDINAAMVGVGKERAASQQLPKNCSLSWIVGDAETLPLPSSSMDAYTIAFGIRNCTNIDKVLAEAYRVLKPGGRFLCLEFSHIETFGMENPLLQSLYDAYSFNVIPALGQLVANDRESYQYLVESIRKFPTQTDFAEMIEGQGFKLVNYKNLSLGIAAIHSGFKL